MLFNTPLLVMSGTLLREPEVWLTALNLDLRKWTHNRRWNAVTTLWQY